MSKIHKYIYNTENPNEITIELEQTELLPPVTVVQSVHFPEKEINNELDLIERENIVPIEEIIVPSLSVDLDKSIDKIIQPIMPNIVEEVTIYPSEEYDLGLAITPSIEEVQIDTSSHSEDLPEINDPAPVDERQTQVLEGDKNSATTGWSYIFTGIFNIFKNYTTKKEATEEISKILNQSKIDADPNKIYEALEQSKHLPPEEIEPSVIKLVGDIVPETQAIEENKNPVSSGWSDIISGLFNIFKNYTTKKEATEEMSKILNQSKIDADPNKLYEALEQSRHLPPEEIEPSVIKLLGDTAPETQTAEGNKTHSYCEIM